jgi:pSer/pThr/pTyr-binding forkhead associated (FHA) protein
LIGFAIVAGIFYGVYAYFQKQPGTVSQKLEQLGVQIPKPDDQDSITPAGPINLPKPEPPQKIILDGASPIPISTPSPIPMSGAVALGEPVLVNAIGIEIPLMEGETIVGRDPGLGLSLTGETTVSRKHASLQRQGGTVTVNDLGSTNGTFVNGARLQSPVALRAGDSVQFGSVGFRYQG